MKAALAAAVLLTSSVASAVGSDNFFQRYVHRVSATADGGAVKAQFSSYLYPARTLSGIWFRTGDAFGGGLFDVVASSGSDSVSGQVTLAPNAWTRWVLPQPLSAQQTFLIVLNAAPGTDIELVNVSHDYSVDAVTGLQNGPARGGLDTPPRQRRQPRRLRQRSFARHRDDGLGPMGTRGLPRCERRLRVPVFR